MKYSNEIIIDLPRDEVIKKFNDPDSAFKWMEGLQSWDVISGEQGEEGTKSKMVFKSRGRTMEMEEEITKKDLPDMMNFVFTAKGVTNWNDNRFESIDENRTKWVQSNVFKFKGMIKVMAFFMPGAFKKQSVKYMNDFKQYAEKGVDVNAK